MGTTSQPEPLLPFLEVAPEGSATHSVIWLHGLGDSGYGHEDVVRALRLPGRARPRFLLPHAPSIPVALNGGMVMPAWYDVYALGSAVRQDAEGIARSAARILQLLDAEAARGVPPERQIVAGFSQGGVLALQAGLRGGRALAGVVALSTYLAAEEEDVPRARRADPLPVFVGHGSADPMVPVEAGRRTRRILEARGYPVAYREYPMGHSICMEEIEDISKWLSPLMGGDGSGR